MQEDEASRKTAGVQRNSSSAETASRSQPQSQPDPASRQLLYSVAQRAEKAGTGAAKTLISCLNY